MFFLMFVFMSYVNVCDSGNVHVNVNVPSPLCTANVNVRVNVTVRGYHNKQLLLKLVSKTDQG